MEPAYIMGIRCVVVGTYKTQRKTSRNRLLNWIFKKVYGFEEKHYMPDGVDCYYVKTDNVLLFRDKDVLERTMRALERREGIDSEGVS